MAPLGRPAVPGADRGALRVEAFFEALWREHVTVDFVHPEADVTAYKLVVPPSSSILAETAAKNLHRYVEGGGHLMVSYFPGPDRRPGLRELLAEVLDHARVSGPAGLPDTVEVVRRGGHVFLINHGDRPATVRGVSGRACSTARRSRGRRRCRQVVWR
ncbi:beta-galactosidase trimerization domain-containing protein [Microbispora sp. ATCC PTA-5024]|uniref:beta-galactosidase trimerization domain-containing protein n=1 Tax=Microbispora sp. ATCC PTA-5024 TaxID=316330 RepID=UPI0003DD595D|nr:beta-galactosidase trimerization domain-containing protein [Microbispora sp. ATCC PTA-5024]ETK32145.1 hypothetical protein MPTA5024_31250 [Microbispora sp. ATCC PTA-5024]